MLNSIEYIYFTPNPSLNPFLDGQSSEIGLNYNPIFTPHEQNSTPKFDLSLRRLYIFHKFPVLKKYPFTTGAAIFLVPK